MKKLLLAALISITVFPSVARSENFTAKDNSYLSDFRQDSQTDLRQEIDANPKGFIHAANMVCNMRYGGLTNEELFLKQIEQIPPKSPDSVIQGRLVYISKLDTLTYKHYCPQYTPGRKPATTQDDD